MSILNDFGLVVHFLAEVCARRYERDREPEPDLVMENPENVREYREAGLVDGNGSSVYLLNLLLLCGVVRPGIRVVDLACGPANLLVALAAINPEVDFIGVDLSPEMLRQAEELRAETGVTNVRFLREDISRISGLASGSVDLVMSTLSLHHLPTQGLLERTFGEVARIVRPGGHVHLMDFAGLKREATVRYFSRERTKGLGRFLAKDYENSLRAAYRIEDLRALMPVIRRVVPALRLHKTFGVPFLAALTSVPAPVLSADQAPALATYWSRMKLSQRKDFDALRLFFRLDGLQIPDPRQIRASVGRLDPSKVGLP